MKKQIIYLISGNAHLPYLVVSLHSLQKHYNQIPVHIFVWPESLSYVQQIANDFVNRSDLEVWYHPREPKYRRKDGVKGNAQFIDKIDLMSKLGCDLALYLDADTMVQGNLEHLFNLANITGFCATQFNDWTTKGGQPRKRVSRLLGREGIEQDSVQWVLDNDTPSPNGGVFCCKPQSPVLDTWYDWTLKVKDLFIADEVVLHSLIGRYVGLAELSRISIAPGVFNSAPKFTPDEKDKDVRIWHFHGDSCCRQNKSPKGVYLWWPVYQECLKHNIGGMSDWIGQINNRHLRRLESTPDDCCRYCGGDATEGHNRKCPMRKLDHAPVG